MTGLGEVGAHSDAIGERTAEFVAGMAVAPAAVAALRMTRAKAALSPWLMLAPRTSSGPLHIGRALLQRLIQRQPRILPTKWSRFGGIEPTAVLGLLADLQLSQLGLVPDSHRTGLVRRLNADKRAGTWE